MKIYNRKARFNYKLETEKTEAGISLSGAEAKAIRTGHLDLSQSTARILDGEVWLINANIPVSGLKNYNATRSRKLLLHKKEIFSLQSKIKQRKLTFVPVRVYTKGHLVKVELRLGKTKRKFEKKQAIKKKDIEREIAGEIRSKY